MVGLVNYGVDLGHRRHLLPGLRNCGYDFESSPGLAQTGNKGKGIRKERIDHQDVDGKPVLANELTGGTNILCGNGIVASQVQCLTQPEDEAQIGIDEKKRWSVISFPVPPLLFLARKAFLAASRVQAD
jgi:hypothetical protein